MKAYVCVYRRSRPSKKDFECTRQAARRDPLVGRFLDVYYNDESYFDWGDDPAFFSAQHRLNDVSAASWGVCRPDVRAALAPGDFVAFFCGRAELESQDRWKYFFTGVGTVSQTLSRAAIWQRPSLAVYRQFYNVLAKWEAGEWAQQETFYPYHANWQDRARSPYILFEQSNSAFNLTTPLHVATYTGEIPESWHLDRSHRVRQLHDILFTERDVTRRLRTARRGYGHSKLNIGGPSHAPRPGRALHELREALMDLVGVPT